MECKAWKMKVVPELIVFVTLSVITFTSCQQDGVSFIASRNKFTARSFPQPDSPSTSRAGRPSNRRNVFFPPPDRLSPTLRPIFSNQGVESTTSKPPVSLSRFHPSGPSKYSPDTKTENPDDYYEYDYYDYYYDDENTTSTTSRPVVVSLPSKERPKNPPTAFSKFHTGNFRFGSPKKESPVRTSPARTSPARTSPVRTSTPTPFRFRFTTNANREKVTRPTPQPSSSSGRKGLLADLLAQLKSQVSSPESHSSNDVDSNRVGKKLEDKSTFFTTTNKPTEESSRTSFRITNSTESSFAIGSVLSSHSIKDKSPTDDVYSSTTEKAEQNTPSFGHDTTYVNDVQTTSEPYLSRSEGIRLLDDEPADENVAGIPEPEGPPTGNSFSSLFENIHIAVDPSLLPPGYSVDEAATESQQDEPKSSTPDSSLDSFFSSLPKEDVTSLLPPGYISSSTSTESIVPKEVKSSTELEPPLKDIVLEVETQKEVSSPKPSITDNLDVEINQIDPTSSLPTGFSSENNTEKEEKLDILVSEVDVSSFLPPDFKEKLSIKNEEEKSEQPVVSSVDISKFLPADYKEKIESTTEKELPAVKIKEVDVNAFLPPGYKPLEENTTDELPGVPVASVDVSAFLPPGYKAEIESEPEEKEENPLPGVVVKTVDLSKFLPPGYNAKDSSKSSTTTTTTTEATATTRKVGPSGIVFPRRPNRPKYLTTTTTTSKPRISGPPPVKPKIQNLFDRVKALGTTEYKVPVVTEKIQPKKAAEINEASTTPSTTTTTSTTTTIPTTTTPPRPTTPGVCGSKCRLAASLRLVSGTEWRPELANRDTYEFEELANEIETELDAFFRSSSISLWYDYVEVDSFNQGSVIVSYILSLSEIKADVDTKDLKERLNNDLERVAHSLGNFTVDPEGTDFTVIPKKQVVLPDDSQNFLIPEWLIAVIVIGLASFLFILIFGVVALVSRARVRKRANVPLTEEFLNNLNALQVNGIDNYAMNGLYDMEPVWNEKYPEKVMKPPSSRGKGYNPEYNVNIYDSWRTDYSGPYTSSSANHSKRRTELEFDGKQFYKDDPYDF